MKKTIILTENELKSLIKKVIAEQRIENAPPDPMSAKPPEPDWSAQDSYVNDIRTGERRNKQYKTSPAPRNLPLDGQILLPEAIEYFYLHKFDRGLNNYDLLYDQLKQLDGKKVRGKSVCLSHLYPNEVYVTAHQWLDKLVSHNLQSLCNPNNSTTSTPGIGPGLPGLAKSLKLSLRGAINKNVQDKKLMILTLLKNNGVSAN